MGQRGIAAALLLVSCGSAVDTASDVEALATAQANTTAIGEAEPGDICFRLDTAFEDTFPDASQRVEGEVSGAWGIELRVSMECRRRLRYDYLEPAGNSAATVGRTNGTDIWVNSGWGDWILDVDLVTCRTEYGGQRVMLQDILIHEVGHILLGDAHTDGPSDAMRQQASQCAGLMPTDDELSRVVIP